MANTISQQVLVDGSKNAVIKTFIASDGATGDVTDTVVADASALLGAPTTLTLEKIWFSTTGASATLEFDATADVGIMGIPDGVADELCFKSIGGIPNNSGAGKTGDIVLSTTGLATAGDSVTVILWVTKD